MNTHFVARLLCGAALGLTIVAAAGGAEAKGLRFGFSQVTLQSPFYVQLRDGAAAAAKADGDELVFLDANGDVSKQNNDIQDLITQKVDVLIVNPVNADAVGPSLEAAKAAKIPVITVDRSVGEKVSAHIGRDNKQMGKLVGEAVVAALKKAGKSNAKIIEIQGDAGGAVMMDRRDGFHSAVEGSGAKIVEGPYAEYVRANAVTAMQDLLQANPDVAVVYAHNDDMALGALQVLQEAGRKDVMVAGVDGLSEALEAIQSGNQYVATSLNDPKYLGDVTIQVARELKNGGKVPAFVDAGTQVVTKDTVGAVKHDGLFAEYRPKVLGQ
ncbi:ribose transport system substrate-binding protein [Faunimonas pinastri]|uniref:Ribose transport system substrate-binding protein n=1 Tax=Faunimonas pinastri TaxID=1855383 RepID=A0A1H9ET94_9HYPH|nr:substrate-binding domain-containing protein [Faunimonas pinastri]SEQ28855.1 ribose transport system substrate-binding protein [Faunimonas pinastri]